jgi:hypothetical protein
MSFTQRLSALHREAEGLAFTCYLRTGHVPPLLLQILHAAQSPELFLKYSADQPRVPAGNPGTGGRFVAEFNTKGAVDYLHEKINERLGHHPETIYGTRDCAGYVHDALNKGGKLNVSTPKLRPGKTYAYARDYGPELEKAGFEKIQTTSDQQDSPPADYHPQAGDVVVIQPAIKPEGHIQMYDGKGWISDFYQNHFWPGPSYKEKKPSTAIYRHTKIKPKEGGG